MAVTANVYNHLTALYLGQAVALANMKLMLLKNTAVFNATHTTVDQVAGPASPNRVHEFFGSSWPQGGKTVASVAATTITTNDAKLAGDQTSQDAVGGIIGPCRYVLLYDSVSNKPHVLYDLGQDEYAGETTPFKLTFDLTGTPGTIFNLNVAP